MANKKWGDRKDGRKIRDIDGMHQILLRLKTKRCNSDVYINYKVDMTEIIKFYKEKRKKYPDLTYFHIFVTAISKVLYNRPLINRFVCNKNIYEHNDISIGFAAKVALDDSSREFISVIKIDEKDTIYEVKDKFTQKVQKIRSNTVNDTDKTVDIIGKLPKFLVTWAMGLFKFLDKHGWVPSSLISDDLYHSSMIISNLGSIGCGSIYHNLTDFGTASSLMTIGTIHKEPVVDENDKLVVKDVCDFGINLDERISDGVYMVNSVKLFEKILLNPKLLEERIDEKIK